MTLLETLMALFIMSIGMGGFSMLFLWSSRMNGFILETGVASSVASRAVDVTIADLRRIRQGDDGSYPIVSGNSFDFKAFLDVDNDGTTERVHYYLENSTFKRGVTRPNVTQPVTYPVADQSVTEIANYVANLPSEPIFSYYNDNYPGDIVNNPLVTPLSVQDARLVRIRLIINIDPRKTPNKTNVESIAEFRNLNEYVQ